MILPRCCSHRAGRLLRMVLVVSFELFVPSAPHAKYLTITHHWQIRAIGGRSSSFPQIDGIRVRAS